MQELDERESVHVPSGDSTCAAWWYPGTNGACVIMAGRDPLLLPLAGRPGTVAVLTTPDALDGASALNPDDRYSDWRQEVAARSLLRAGGPGGQGGPPRRACLIFRTTAEEETA